MRIGATLRTDTFQACHCAQCRRWAGGSALFVIGVRDLEIEGTDSIAQYQASAHGERAFCRTCGTTLYWRMQGGRIASVAVGLFDDQSDLTVSEVVRGGPALDSRPYGAIATVQRIAIDLRYALDRASYGNIVSLTHESGVYLNEALAILNAPDIKRAYDATNRWQALEGILKRHRGAIGDLSQRAKMAEAGRRILQWVAGTTFDSDVDADSFRVQARTAGAHAEAWIAAYRLTRDGRRFPGANANLKWSRGLPDGTQETVYH